MVTKDTVHIQEALGAGLSTNPIATIPVVQSEAINCLALREDKKLVACGSDDGTVRIWHTDEADAIRRLLQCRWRAPIEFLTLSCDNQNIVWIDRDSTVCQLSLSNAEEEPSPLEEPKGQFALWKARRKQIGTDGTETDENHSKACVILHEQDLYSYEPSGNENKDKEFVKVGHFGAQVKLWETDGELAIAMVFEGGALALVGIANGFSKKKRKLLHRIIDKLQGRG